MFPLTPRDAFVKNVEALPEDTLLRLPLTMIARESGGGYDAFLGAIGSEERFPVMLDDTALGMSLDMRVPGLCGNASSCLIEVDCYWGSLLADSDDHRDWISISSVLGVVSSTPALVAIPVVRGTRA